MTPLPTHAAAADASPNAPSCRKTSSQIAALPASAPWPTLYLESPVKPMARNRPDGRRRQPGGNEQLQYAPSLPCQAANTLGGSALVPERSVPGVSPNRAATVRERFLRWAQGPLPYGRRSDCRNAIALDETPGQRTLPDVPPRMGRRRSSTQDASALSGRDDVGRRAPRVALRPQAGFAPPVATIRGPVGAETRAPSVCDDTASPPPTERAASIESMECRRIPFFPLPPSAFIIQPSSFSLSPAVTLSGGTPACRMRRGLRRNRCGGSRSDNARR